MPDNECDVPAEYSQVLAFNTSFKGLLSEDKFIARSDYKHLIEKYKRLFDFFKVLESSNLLNDYIKKHKLDEAQIIYFSNAYNDTKELQKESSIIKMHNDKYISQHLVSEKDYLDRILRECDSAILLDNEQREVVLSDEDHTLVIAGAGAGKTTIINLLMRFYDIDSGKITIDGNDITKVTRDSLRRAFAMVLQDTWLFHGTIYENIAYGKPDATLEDVKRVCKAARIHNYIMRLPKQYDTVLTDDGRNISKGQKQLLTIARAMLLDAHMLILDEATSNVDTRTELQIQEAMLELMKDKTCFVIAHRLSTIQNADCILVVKEGEVIEQGTHDELMEKRGFYRSLYDSQFAGKQI